MPAIKYPTGYRSRPDHLQVAINFPDAMFNTILSRAKREKKTFNAMVVELVTVGEFDLSECDKHEVAA